MDLCFLSCVCYAFVRVCLFVPCGHLLGKGRSLDSPPENQRVCPYFKKNKSREHSSIPTP